MTIHVGTSGWSYDHWQGVLYSPGLPASKRLDCYVARFHTVEVNSTFYHWPRDTTFAGWHKRLPQGFLMTVKAPRGLTHATRLYAPERWLEIITRGIRGLEGNLGVLLVQLAPDFAYDYDRLAYFLDCVPSWIKTTVEFRHPSWHQESVFSLLKEKGAAYCVMSGAGLPCILRATAPFVYVRMHGPDTQHLYGGSYPEDDLRWWRDRIQEWADSGKDVFVYFNNDGEGNAVRNADTLKGLLGI